MPQPSCLYALISGTATPVPLEAPTTNEQMPGQKLALSLLEILQSRAQNVTDLLPPRLPLICELYLAEQAGRVFGFWLTPSQFSVDTLISLQAAHDTGQWLNELHRRGQSCGDETLCFMAQASSIDRALAILGAAVAEEAIHNPYDRPDSPWVRDKKLCEKIIKDLRAWAEVDVPSLRRTYHYRNRVLYQTPFSMSARATNDIEHDFLDHIASRIGHCLKTYRPVLIHQTKTAPNQMVATLIDMAQKQGAGA